MAASASGTASASGANSATAAGGPPVAAAPQAPVPAPAAARPAAPTAPMLTGGARAVTTLALALGTFMQVLDTTVANVSIPTIAGNLVACNN